MILKDFFWQVFHIRLVTRTVGHPLIVTWLRKHVPCVLQLKVGWVAGIPIGWDGRVDHGWYTKVVVGMIFSVLSWGWFDSLYCRICWWIPFATSFWCYSVDLKHMSFSKHLDAINLNMNAFPLYVFNIIWFDFLSWETWLDSIGAIWDLRCLKCFRIIFTVLLWFSHHSQGFSCPIPTNGYTGGHRELAKRLVGAVRYLSRKPRIKYQLDMEKIWVSEISWAYDVYLLKWCATRAVEIHRIS